MQKILFTFLVTFFVTFLNAAPQAIVFDYGGVMTGAPNREAVVDFICETFHFTKAEFEQANAEKRAAIKQGMSDVEFWIAYAQKKGIQLPCDWQNSFNQAMISALGVNPSMYAFVEELRECKVTIALLSNVDERYGHLIREYGLYAAFNPCLLSYEIGFEKPDPQIFLFLLKTLNLQASEVVFIDDRLENVEAAKALGIDALLFTSEDQLRADLAQRGLQTTQPALH